jgi:hypothetical protein
MKRLTRDGARRNGAYSAELIYFLIIAAIFAVLWRLGTGVDEQ